MRAYELQLRLGGADIVRTSDGWVVSSAEDYLPRRALDAMCSSIRELNRLARENEFLRVSLAPVQPLLDKDLEAKKEAMERARLEAAGQAPLPFA